MLSAGDCRRCGGYEEVNTFTLLSLLTTRDIFYREVTLFRTQQAVDKVIHIDSSKTDRTVRRRHHCYGGPAAPGLQRREVLLSSSVTGSNVRAVRILQGSHRQFRTGDWPCRRIPACSKELNSEQDRIADAEMKAALIPPAEKIISIHSQLSWVLVVEKDVRQDSHFMGELELTAKGCLQRSASV